MTARDFIVPDAPKTAMCRFSLVSRGIQTALPWNSPKITPSALSGVDISRVFFISLSVIKVAVPYSPESLTVKPLGSFFFPSNLSYSFTKRKITPAISTKPIKHLSPFSVNAAERQSMGFMLGDLMVYLPLKPSCAIQSA